jgi:hypothetical protein
MRDMLYVIRFFHVVPPVPPLVGGTLAVITAISSAAVVSTPQRATGALAPVLLLQLFAASSGFALPARRGHYDLLLTRGGSRARVAIAHWLASVAPGIVSWLVLAGVEVVAGQGANAALLASGTVAAVFVVSTLPWALTVALPRFSGGIGWLLALVTAATTFSAGVIDDWAVGSTSADALAWAAWMFLLYPLSAVGQPLAPLQVVAAAPALALAVASMVVACRWASRADVPLEAAQ